MAFTDYVSADVVPWMASGLIMIALAGWVLRIDPRNRLNQVFAFFLTTRALLNLSLAFEENTGRLTTNAARDGALLGWADWLQPVVHLAVPFVATYFIYTYISQARENTKWKLALPLGLMAVAAVLEVLYFVNRDWWISSEGIPGPLFVFVGFIYLAYGIITLLLVREYLRDEEGPHRRGLYFVALGFAFLPMYVGVGEFTFVDVLNSLERAGASDLGIYFDAAHYLSVAAILPVGAAIGLLITQWARSRTEGDRNDMFGFGLLMVLPLASLAVCVFVYQRAPDDVTAFKDALPLFKTFEGIWTLPHPILVAFSLVRYQLFDVQLHMKKRLRQAITGLVFAVSFFIVSEGTEALASNIGGDTAGLTAAAALTLGLKPVQGFADRVTNAALPSIKRVAEMSGKEQLDFYREQLEMLTKDGHLSDKDRHMLDASRTKLGISVEESLRIEALVMRGIAA